MRRTMKFLHTASAIGLAGGMAAYIAVLIGAGEVTSLEAHAALRNGLALVSKWVILPSMLVVLVSGLLAIAVHYPFMEAPWVWVKALSGILIFEATLASVDAPAQRAAEAAQQALAGEIDASALAGLMRDEWGAWWMLLALAAANVALAIWRPKFGLKGK